MNRTFFDVIFTDMSDRDKELAKAALGGRRRNVQREKDMLRLGDYPERELWRIEAAFAANMAAHHAFADSDGSNPHIKLTLDSHLEAISAAATAMVEARLKAQETCDCNVCQLRRRYEAGEVPSTDLDRLLAEAIAKDDAARSEPDVPENPNHLTEKDLEHGTAIPNESSPWGYGMAYSKPADGGELSPQRGQDDVSAASRQGSGS